MQQEIINFYSTTDEWGAFSNFSRHRIYLDQAYWPTTEHYFQAQKFTNNPAYQEEIRQAKTAMIAARLGRSRKHKLRKDWESVKDQVMYNAVLTKFEQHKELKASLLSTQNAKLVEHTANDSYWGDGGDGSGKNMLGQILMQVRAELKTKSEPL